MVFVVFEGNNHFIWRPLIGWASTIATEFETNPSSFLFRSNWPGEVADLSEARSTSFRDGVITFTPSILTPLPDPKQTCR